MGTRLFAVLAAFALASAPLALRAQTGTDGLRDAIIAETPRPPASFWTPSALRTILIDEPIAGGTLPRGFAVRRIESRKPTQSERDAGMAYRVDVVLNGPYPSQTLSYRIYDTVESAAAAADNKTLSDDAVTLTSESLAAPMLIALPNGRVGRCARVRSAAFADLVFMRCYGAFAGLPVVVGGSVGAPDNTLTDPNGNVDLQRLDLEKVTPAALLRAGLSQLDAFLADDPNGHGAYIRDHMQNAATTPAPH